MTSNRATPNNNHRRMPGTIPLASSYYALLGLHPSASAIAIRRAYRELSKQYHPDTTNLPAAIATAKFQQLNEAYATLSNPERRLAYDHKIAYSRISVIQTPPHWNHPVSQSRATSSASAYLDPTDRPLSAGEIFALFSLIVTFLGCLLIAIAIGLTRGETAFQPLTIHSETIQEQIVHPPATASKLSNPTASPTPLHLSL